MILAYRGKTTSDRLESDRFFPALCAPGFFCHGYRFMESLCRYMFSVSRSRPPAVASSCIDRLRAIPALPETSGPGKITGVPLCLRLPAGHRNRRRWLSLRSGDPTGDGRCPPQRPDGIFAMPLHPPRFFVPARLPDCCSGNATRYI